MVHVLHIHVVNLFNVKSELYLNMNGGKQSRGFMISIQDDEIE